MYRIVYLDGATTIYTSAKENSNLNVLYDYITHRVYQFDLELVFANLGTLQIQLTMIDTLFHLVMTHL